MKKLILTTLTLILSLLVMIAYYQKNKLTNADKVRPITSQQETGTSSLGHLPNSDIGEESRVSEEKLEVTETMANYLGNWELKIAGQEGYQLVIAETAFQFYALYNGHVVPPNKKEVSYQFSTDGQTITAVGVRDESDAIGGEDIGNQQVRDTLVISLKGDQKITIVANGSEIALSDEQSSFVKTSDKPEITELPGN